MRSIATRLFVLIVVMSMPLLGAERWIGTWKYNLSKSSSTANNPIRNRTETIETIETTSSGVQVTPFDAIRATRVDEYTHTFEIKNSKNKYHLTGKATVSADGKTRTQTSLGTDRNGAPLAATSVYDRQSPLPSRANAR